MNDRVTLFGEVVGVSGEDRQVRLDTDELAILRDDGDVPTLVGYRGEFVVEGHTPDGRTIVSPFRQAGSEGSAKAFDLEFDRLHSALSGRRAGTRAQAPTPAARSIQEEEMRAWAHRVDDALARFRKRRARRLNESSDS